MSENKNMELWDKVCKTNPDTTRNVSFGARKFTSVCAQSQIKRATEVWGAMGSTWGVKDPKYTLIGETAILYEALLTYPNGSLPISSDMQIIKAGKYQEDWAKKTATDALTKGLSKLGFNSDLFEGKFDDNKYVEQMKQEFGGNKEKNNKTDFDRNVAITAIKDYMQKHAATMEYRSEVERSFDHATTREDFNAIRANVVKDLKNDSRK